MLQFYNTLTRAREPFRPLQEGKIGLYTCGPTVYDYAHIGNFRAYVWEDLLKRYLLYKGFDVHHVMNITDVDDKTIRGANDKGVELDEFTQPFIDAFFEDLDTLRIDRADEYPRATRHIEPMVEMIQALQEKGYTYEADGSIYFRIGAFEEYGRLSRIDPDEVRTGARVEDDEYEKQDVRDFVLWKAPKEDEPTWDTAIGRGRPGWHIECSAMSSAYLGNHFDIHTGGVDNMFPHHENEIAQSVCSTGEPFVNTWMHCAHLIVDGEKMSKSLGNFYTLRDLLDRGADPRAIRYLLIATNYRKQLNFTFEGLDNCAAALQRMEEMAHRLKTADLQDTDDKEILAEVQSALEGFEKEMDDDLNVSGALGVVFDLVRAVNAALDRGSVSPVAREKIFDAVAGFDRVFCVFDLDAAGLDEAQVDLGEAGSIKVISDIPLTESLLADIQIREQARADKNWPAADAVRERLRAQGLTLKDTPEGLHVLKDA